MFERDAWGVIRRRRTERVCSCVFVCVCPCPWVYAWMPIMYVRNSEHLCMWVCMCGRVSSHFQSIELLRCWCMLSAVLVLVQQNIMCGVKERGDGRKQKEGWGGGCTEGAVCHCESAQGGSHHLAIDGCPSPVVKQAPVGLPEHWGHCVPPLQETCHPKCCYPPPPPSTHSISSPLPSPSRSILSTLAPAQPCVNLKLAVKATRHNGVARSFECNR